MESLKDYIRENRASATRIAVVAAVLLIAAPVTWYFVHTSEEKAYVNFTNGYYYYRNHNYDQAAGALQQLIDLYPNSDFTPLGRYYLGLTYLEVNHLPDAAGQFQYFIDQNPKHFLRDRVYAMWMSLELQSGHPDNCVSLADRYLAEFPKDAPATPEILYRKGVALLQLGRTADAESCFDAAGAGAKETNVYSNFSFYARTAHSAM